MPKIEDVSPLAGLTQVSHIDLDSNQVKDISALQNVIKTAAHCSIKNNEITFLPEWITDADVFIHVDNRNINEIKYEERTYLSLTDNPLSDPPVEIIRQGRDAIKRYFERKKEEAFSSIREAKLILVGDGAAGKTSLALRLQDTKAELPAEDKRTRGIRVDDWGFKKGFMAHIWDFGGQDVYYPVHRFFMTENAVFVLLASTRHEQHNFDYWIPTIYQFGGSSPIIIGQTCHDGNPAPWNDLGMYISRPEFNIIKTSVQPYYELNLPNRNRGLAGIRKVIIEQLCQLPHCRKDAPVSWIRVRNALKELARREPCISYDRFSGMCMEQFPVGSRSPEDIADCCAFLHHTGALFWYSANTLLRNFVILDPYWAVKAVYKIIDDEKIQRRKGHIVAGDFSRLWNERNDRTREDILRQMLIVFRVAFPKKHKPDEFIIPARLVSIPSEKRWQPEACVRLEYTYTFMPRGILNQLSAELSRYIVIDKEGNEEVWNNAVNFTVENGDCQVYEDFYRKQIVLLACGEDTRGNIKLVMNTLKDIHDHYKGVDPEIMVPCNCAACMRGRHVSQFEYSKLIRWSKERQDHPFVFCNESGREIRISHLLNEVGLPAPATAGSVTFRKKIPETIRIFLASSYELKEEREAFEQMIGRQNKRLHDRGLFLHLDVWEDLPSHIPETRLQDEYNKKVKECDVFICLCYSWMGKYTEEEFDVAYNVFKATGKPYIYVFLKEPPFPAGIKSAHLKSREEFEDKLRKLDYFPIPYKNTDSFLNHITSQLEELIRKEEFNRV